MNVENPQTALSAAVAGKRCQHDMGLPFEVRGVRNGVRVSKLVFAPDLLLAMRFASVGRWPIAVESVMSIDPHGRSNEEMQRLCVVAYQSAKALGFISA